MVHTGSILEDHKIELVRTMVHTNWWGAILKGIGCGFRHNQIRLVVKPHAGGLVFGAAGLNAPLAYLTTLFKASKVK